MRSPIPLFRQVIAVNVVVFGVACLLLAVTPATVSSPLTLNQAIVLAAGMVVVVLADVLLVRRAFTPLTRLGRVIDRVDLLGPGERIDVSGSPPEIVRLVDALNAMLGRLEDERYASDRRALQAQEAERARIARELHDELGQNLTALLVHVRRAERVVPDEIRADLELAHEAARVNLDEVHRIVQQLRPQALEDLGLVDALAGLAEATSARAELTVALDAPGAVELPDDVELTLYRISQEALTNIIRHARASRVDVRLRVDGGTAELVIDDDGIGLRERDADRNGLVGMEERTRLVGGRLEIADRNGGGASVRVAVPAAAERNGDAR